MRQMEPERSRETSPDEEAERLANDERKRQTPRARLQRTHWDARVHEAEEEERDLRRIAPPHLELIQRVSCIRASIDKEPGIACRVRQERHDRDERERGMHAAPVHAEPGCDACGQHIRPEAADTPPAE